MATVEQTILEHPDKCCKPEPEPEPVLPLPEPPMLPPMPMLPPSDITLQEVVTSFVVVYALGALTGTLLCYAFSKSE